MNSLWTIMCAILLAATSAAQPAADSLQHDTTLQQRITIVDPGISSGRPLLFLPPELTGGEALLPPFFGISSLRAGAPSLLDGIPSGGKLDLLLPLRAQMSAESSIQPFRVMLGAATLGGAAYIAYRHLKKYGLMK